MKGSDAALLSAAVTAGLAQQAAAVVVVGAPGMDHDYVLVVESLAAHGHGLRTGNLSRLSKKVGLADLVAAARRSRRQVKERSRNPCQPSICPSQNCPLRMWRP